jgi:regulatory protein YycH of two-component signal transduction system YycFG
MDQNKANIYSAIIAVVTIYLIIIAYVVHYFKEDFEAVFCNKKKVNDVKVKAN